MLALSCIVFLGQTIYTVSLSGSVIDEETGEAVADYPVYVITDSIIGFYYAETMITNDDGSFEDSFEVPGGIEGNLFVIAMNCENMQVVSEMQFSENNSELFTVLSICTTPINDDCEAMFYSYPAGNELLTLQFMDVSLGFPTTWDWDFGDGDTSTEQNPMHTFPDFGEYLVSLTISDDSLDCTSSIEMPVIVGDSIWFPDSCMAWFFAVPDSSDYLTFHFMDMSIGENGNPVTNWFWDFGDGSTSDEQNPIHKFNSEGFFEVCLTISDDNQYCTSTYCEGIEAVDWDNYCQAEFYYYPVFDSVGNTWGNEFQFVDYSYGNPTSWSWDFGDGNTSESQNPVHEYAEEGTFNVCLSISNPADSCESTLCQEVFVGNDTITDCFGWFEYEIEELTVAFSGYLNNSPEGYYTWDFGDGTTGEGQTISHTYAEDSIYTVTMMVEDSSSNCYTSYIEILWVGEDFSFDISGAVYLNDSMMVSDFANVYLMTYDSVGGNLVSVEETQIDENGNYLFENVSDNNFLYFVKAELTEASSYYGEYIPTYHLNAMNWEEAWPVFPFPNVYGYDVYLIPVETFSPGPGDISGNVSYDGERNILEKINVMLLDTEGNALTFQKTDESGIFDFSSLSFGTYVVYTEIMGVHTVPVTIELNEENQEVYLNIVIKNGEAVLGIDEVHSAIIEEVGDIYPNPTNGEASINITLKQETKVKLEVVNKYGQLIAKSEIAMQEGTQKVDLSTNSIPRGIYFVSIMGDDGIKLIKKLVKL